jgi:hypothetical protein
MRIGHRHNEATAGAQWWGPMAFAIIGGLAGATLLTLIFLPPLYVAWFRISEPIAAPAARPVDANGGRM